MKITDIISQEILKKMPVSLQYLKPIDKSISVFINKHVSIKKYQSFQCSVYPPLKPISKIL